MATVGLALLTCGCTSTQTTAARLQLNDSRLRASAESVRVTAGHTSTAVSVVSKTFLSQRGAFEVAVTLENHSDQAVSDLPISVGYETGAKTVYLNGAAGLAYFKNHIPSITAHGTLTWVYTAAKQLPRHARTFARVGAKSSTPLGRFTPPVISVAAEASAAANPSSVMLRLRNRSSIPQYQLPVYAVVSKGTRIVAASDGSIADLAGGAKAVIRIVFAPPETADSAHIRVEAPATIFK